MLNAMTRREVSISFAALLAGCSSTGGTGGVTLAMAQAYGDALIAALESAAQVYLDSPIATQKALVTTAVADLKMAQSALDSLTPTSDTRAVVQQIIAAAQQLLPLVTALLGPAAPYASLAIVVLQAFIALVPLPANTPPTPPEPLVTAPQAMRAAHPAAFRRH
jgi:hypothetical protein